jgi:hypothetical protein
VRHAAPGTVELLREYRLREQCSAPNFCRIFKVRGRSREKRFGYQNRIEVSGIHILLTFAKNHHCTEW